jgi:hypothetical protein
MIMFSEKLNSLLTSINIIIKKIWYFMIINFEINTIKVFRIELFNMFKFYKLCYQNLINIKKTQTYLNENNLIYSVFLMSICKKKKLFFFIKKFHENLYLKCLIRIKIENLLRLKKKKQIQKFLNKLTKIKKLYKKNFGIKVQKSKNNLFFFYSNINYINTSKILIHLKKKGKKKIFFIKKFYDYKINIIYTNSSIQTLTELFVIKQNYKIK